MNEQVFYQTEFNKTSVLVTDKRIAIGASTFMLANVTSTYVEHGERKWGGVIFLGLATLVGFFAHPYIGVTIGILLALYYAGSAPYHTLHINGQQTVIRSQNQSAVDAIARSITKATVEATVTNSSLDRLQPSYAPNPTPEPDPAPLPYTPPPVAEHPSPERDLPVPAPDRPPASNSEPPRPEKPSRTKRAVRFTAMGLALSGLFVAGYVLNQSGSDPLSLSAIVPLETAPAAPPEPVRTLTEINDPSGLIDPGILNQLRAVAAAKLDSLGLPASASPCSSNDTLPCVSVTFSPQKRAFDYRIGVEVHLFNQFVNPRGQGIAESRDMIYEQHNYARLDLERLGRAMRDTMNGLDIE